MVVEIIHAAHIADTEFAIVQKLFAHKNLIEHFRAALVNMAVGHIAFQSHLALHFVSIPQRGIARTSVIGHLARGGDDLGGHAVRAIVEITHHYQRFMCAL